jgi:DNA-directed RNA polymerase specialized sigma24 family protein
MAVEAMNKPGEGEATASDHTLVRRLQSGEGDAATAIYLRYALRVRQLAAAQLGAGLGRRIDPEDIVQSVFRTFFRRTKGGHYAVPQGEELWKLLLVISLHKIRSTATFHRAAKRDVRQTSSLGERDVSANAGDDQEGHLILRMVIDEMLGELPQVQREMIALRIDGYEVAEIATRTSRAKRTVERVLQNFRIRLAGIIQQEMPALSGELPTENETP